VFNSMFFGWFVLLLIWYVVLFMELMLEVVDEFGGFVCCLGIVLEVVIGCVKT